MISQLFKLRPGITTPRILRERDTRTRDSRSPQNLGNLGTRISEGYIKGRRDTKIRVGKVVKQTRKLRG